MEYDYTRTRIGSLRDVKLTKEDPHPNFPERKARDGFLGYGIEVYEDTSTPKELGQRGIGDANNIIKSRKVGFITKRSLVSVLESIERREDKDSEITIVEDKTDD